MPNAEFIQSAAQFAGQAKELIDFGSRTNLLETLTNLGHPYGLLLFSNPSSSEQIVESSLQSYGTFKYGTIDASLEEFPKRKKFPDVSRAELAISKTLGHSVLSSGVKLKLEEHFGSDLSGSVNELSERVGKDNIRIGSLFSLSGGSWTLILSELKGQHNDQALFFTPLWKVLFQEKSNLTERSRELKVGKYSVSLGTTAIKLTTYQGEQPFVVRTPQGEPIAQINPGDELGHLHVSHQAALMRDLSPLQKAEQITKDFIDLFRAVDQATNVGLDAKQQAVLARAQTATLIGISHLVRLFRHRTGLPTWKLDVLPDLLQRFHQHDSQAVSKAFGGTRKVRVNDVEMMVVTPTMRQQLVAAF